MKKLYIILVDDETQTDVLSRKFAESASTKVYCGTWNILFNKAECLDAISCTVNHFIQSIDTEEIYFGISSKDVSALKPLLLLDDCEVIEISVSELQ